MDNFLDKIFLDNKTPRLPSRDQHLSIGVYPQAILIKIFCRITFPDCKQNFQGC